MLIAWELGRGMGHINRLLPLASRLAADGYHVVCAFRSTDDIARISGLLQHTDILPAPIYRRPSENPPARKGFIYNYADLLARCGYDSPASLGDLVRQWMGSLRPSGGI